MLDRVLTEALTLPERERTELVVRLLESFEDDDAALEPEEWAQVWSAEVNRRLADLQAGEARAVPADDVFARAEARFGLPTD